MVLQRQRHDRGNGPHFGIDLDTIIELATALGFQVEGATLHEMLAEIDARITALEQTGIPLGIIQFDAVIMPRFLLDAVVLEEQGGSFNLDAEVSAFTTVPGTFLLDAVMFRSVEASFTLDAEISIIDAFQADTFQNDAFD